MTQAQIVVNPDPPQAGKKCKITYTGTTPATLQLTIEPPGVSQEITVPAGGLEIDVPKDAYGMMIVDPTGAAPGRDLPVA